MHRFPSHVRTLAAVVVLSAMLVASSAGATVLYAYRSTCAINCANIGLSAGDAVGGTIGFADDAVAFGVAFSPADVDVFDVTFGTFTFDLASLDTAFAVFTGLEANAFVFQFVTGVAADQPGYNFSETGWLAGPSVLLAASGGSGTLTRIPEPASMALVALALVLGAAVSRARNPRS